MSTNVSKTLTYILFSLIYLRDKSIMKKAALKIFAIFTGKLQACNFVKKRI